MITFFTTPKPFRGHIGVIQRNAIESWKRIHPSAEVILFGDEEGAAEAASDLRIRHVPAVRRNQHGTKYLSPIFDGAQNLAHHNCLCYINCDIILLSDFRVAAERVTALDGKFLMAGQRWDTDITAPVNFYAPDWEATVSRQALQANQQRPPQWVDYFAFSRGLYGPDMPPFVLRVFWDNWLVWKALDSGKPVIDASRAVMAVHQNHDYSYHPQGKAGIWSGEEAGLNGQLAGGWRHLRTIADATEVLPPEKLKRNALRHWSTAKRYARQAGRVLLNDVWHPIWFALLNLTRPLRNALRIR